MVGDGCTIGTIAINHELARTSNRWPTKNRKPSLNLPTRHADINSPESAILVATNFATDRANEKLSASPLQYTVNKCNLHGGRRRLTCINFASLFRNASVSFVEGWRISLAPEPSQRRLSLSLEKFFPFEAQLRSCVPHEMFTSGSPSAARHVFA